MKDRANGPGTDEEPPVFSGNLGAFLLNILGSDRLVKLSIFDCLICSPGSLKTVVQIHLSNRTALL